MKKTMIASLAAAGMLFAVTEYAIGIGALYRLRVDTGLLYWPGASF